ncbi:hypothetical protein BDB01DRAFT_774751, partial [Pilobolus umbonatus]
MNRVIIVRNMKCWYLVSLTIWHKLIRLNITVPIYRTLGIIIQPKYPLWQW